MSGTAEEAALQRFLALKHGRVLYPPRHAYAVREPGPKGKPVILTEYELTYGRLISDIGKGSKITYAEREKEREMAKRWPYAHDKLHRRFSAKPGVPEEEVLPPPAARAPAAPAPALPPPPAEKPRSALASAVIYARVLIRQGLDHRAAVTRAAGSCGVPIKEVAEVLAEYDE